MRKVAIIGGGNVGATCAYQLASRDAADVAVYDIVEGVPAGKALDMTQVGPVFGFDARVTGSHEVDVIAGAEVVVVTAGFPRKPGMDRMDLLKKNADIARASGEAIRRYAPDSVVVTVTNPLDVMTWVVQQATGFEPSRVVGMAGVLDSARFATFIAMELGASAKDVRAMVLGGHGDSMVPLTRYSTVAGIPLPDLVEMGWTTQEKLDAIVQRTRDGGAEVVGLLKTGSAFYAPAASAIEMAEAYLKDQKRVLPCAAYVDGLYGLKDIYLGVPTVIGAGGIERIVEIELNKAERAMFDKSIESVEGLVKACKGIDPSLG